MSNTSKKELRNRIEKQLTELSPDQVDDQPATETLGDRLAKHGVSRRTFMKYCMGLSAVMAIPTGIMPKLVEDALAATVPAVVYLSFQECTGCLESLVNVFPSTQYQTDSIENIILTALSLNYQETLMAAAGYQAEAAKADTLAVGNHILVVDGAIPNDDGTNGYFIQSGKNGLDLLLEAADNAAAVVCVGTCASFGGLPGANPNPTGAVAISEALRNAGLGKPVINVSGCPPIAEVIAGTLIYWILNGHAPELDSNLRPRIFYGETVHHECYREEFYEHGQFAESFDSPEARQGYCLLHLGCKGPVTHNACTTLQWNQRTGYPMKAGHGCLGCAEPGFWDMASSSGEVGFYLPLSRSGSGDSGGSDSGSGDEHHDDHHHERRKSRESSYSTEYRTRKRDEH